MKAIKDFVKDKNNRTLLVVMSVFAAAAVLIGLEQADTSGNIRRKFVFS